MSTKISLVYNTDSDRILHFYEDVAEPNFFVINQVQNVDLNFKISKYDLLAIARTVDWAELERQSKLSDEQIQNFVKSKVAHRKIQNDMFSEFHNCLIYGNKECSDEEQIVNGTNYFKKIREEIRSLCEKTNQKNTGFVHFGLECIV